MSSYQAGPGNAKGAAPEGTSDWQDVAADAARWMEADQAAKILYQVAECVSQILHNFVLFVLVRPRRQTSRGNEVACPETTTNCEWQNLRCCGAMN